MSTNEDDISSFLLRSPDRYFCFSGIPTILGGSTAENTDTVKSIEQFNGSNWTVEGKVNKLGAWGSSVALPLTENEQC